MGSRRRNGAEQPCAVSEYLIERMLAAGVRKICFVIEPGKSDIMEYCGAGYGEAIFAYVVQPQACGLCDAIFRAGPLLASGDGVAVGLPDTVWFPQTELADPPHDRLSFLTFPIDRPELFDAVVTDESGAVLRIDVKHREAGSHWIWGAVDRAQPRRRIRRHPRQRLPFGRRRGRRHQGRAVLCRCRHAARLSRRHAAPCRGRRRTGGDGSCHQGREATATAPEVGGGAPAAV